VEEEGEHSLRVVREKHLDSAEGVFQSDYQLDSQLIQNQKGQRQDAVREGLHHVQSHHR